MFNRTIKSVLITGISLFAFNNLHAQSWTIANNHLVTSYVFGNPYNVGVGTGTSVAPIDKLTVQGDIGFPLNLGTTVFRKINGRTDKTGLYLYANTDIDDGGTIQLHGSSNTDNPGMVRFVSSNTGTPSETAFAFAHYDANSSNINYSLQIRNDEKVVIGRGIIGNAPNDYKLYVQTGILTEKVKVALTTGSWADFVFDENYDLMSLEELSQYIQENKHLPEIPTTAEVENDGLDLGQMDAKLLQKVEELTLYIIKQQKEIDELKRLLKN